MLTEDECCKIFKEGIWQQHVATGRTMFFYYDAKEEKSNTDDKLYAGAVAYVTATISEVSAISDTCITLDLKRIEALLDSFPQLWHHNKRNLVNMSGLTVPVIGVARGRPKTLKWGDHDCFLGMFSVTTQGDCAHLRVDRDAGYRAKLEALQGMELENGRLRGRPEKRMELENGRLKGPPEKRAKCAGTEVLREGAPLGPVRAYNENSQQCKESYRSAIRDSRRYLWLNAYSLTDGDIISDIVAAWARGVEVRIRYDRCQSEKCDGASYAVDMLVCQIPAENVHAVTYPSPWKLMHKKELFTDYGSMCRLLTGSYNPTKNAQGNEESCYCITDEAVTCRAAEVFIYSWDQEEEEMMADGRASAPSE